MNPGTPDNEMFSARVSVEQVEEGSTLAPKFDESPAAVGLKP